MLIYLKNMWVFSPYISVLFSILPPRVIAKSLYKNDTVSSKPFLWQGNGKKHQQFLTLWTISKEKVEKPTKAFAYKCVSVCVCVGKCCPRRSSSDFVSRGHTYTHTELNILYPPFACTAYLNHKFILTPYYLSALVKVVSLFFSGTSPEVNGEAKSVEGRKWVIKKS